MPNEDRIGSARPIRVLLADDHKLVRAGFRAMLDSLGGIEIVGETGDGREALELIRTQKPDVALLDITMPGLTGIEVATRAASEAPDVRVIILSMHTSEDYIAQAVRAGVSGYLLKNADPVELELALRAAMNREMYSPPPAQTPKQMSPPRQQFQPRLEPMPSVTEHTTRTFSPVYREGSDPDAR